MDTNNIGQSTGSAWGTQQSRSRAANSANKNSFAAHLASNGLAAGQNTQARSGGQLLSDDLSRALAAYGPANGASVGNGIK